MSEYARHTRRLFTTISKSIKITLLEPWKTCRSRSREVPLQPQGIPYREALPVVVEVGKDLGVGAPGGDPLLPLLELRVVAVPAPAAVMEADEGPLRRKLVGLEGTLRMIADGERDPVLAQEGIDLRNEPALMTKLKAVPAGGQPLEREREALVVAAKPLR